MQLALVNGRILVTMQELDRIFDGHDVIELGLVNQIDDGGERGALAAARRSGYQDHSVFQFDNIAQLSRQIEILKGRRPRRNYAHDDRIGATLFEDIDPKTAHAGDAERDVGRPKFVKTLNGP